MEDMLLVVLCMFWKLSIRVFTAVHRSPQLAYMWLAKNASSVSDSTISLQQTSVNAPSDHDTASEQTKSKNRKRKGGSARTFLSV